MIITRTPLRISFVGGGSDLPWFYSEEPGACVSAAIDKYVYVAVNQQFEGRVLAHYRATEDVATVDDLKHDRMRACLRRVEIDRGIEVTSMADVPGSSGLGSSSAFTVGLLAALRPGKAAATYAETACEIELHDCQATIGKQDQYAAAYGGVNLLRFTAEGVTVAPIACDTVALSQHLLLLYTGRGRDGDAGQQLNGQHQKRDNVRLLTIMALEFSVVLANGDLERCGAILHDAWLIKRKYVGTVDVLDWYRAARQAGAWGGKLCGAGGGGFLCFLAPPETHAAIVTATGLRHVPIQAGVPGCEVIYA